MQEGEIPGFSEFDMTAAIKELSTEIIEKKKDLENLIRNYERRFGKEYNRDEKNENKRQNK